MFLFSDSHTYLNLADGYVRFESPGNLIVG